MSFAPDAFPVLSSRRLTLRALSAGDAAAIKILFQCPEVSRFSDLTDMPDERQSKRLFEAMRKAYERKAGCAWAIEERCSRSFIGLIRLNQIERHWKWGEIGYELHPTVWGQGYMTEAVNAVARCAYDRFSLNRIEAWTLPENKGSQRVLDKAGFSYEGTLRQKGWFKSAFHDLMLFSRLATDTAGLG